MSPYDDGWLDIRDVELQLNNPHTKSIRLDDIALHKFERSISQPPQPNAKLRALLEQHRRDR